MDYNPPDRSGSPMILEQKDFPFSPEEGMELFTYLPDINEYIQYNISRLNLIQEYFNKINCPKNLDFFSRGDASGSSLWKIEVYDAYVLLKRSKININSDRIVEYANSYMAKHRADSYIYDTFLSLKTYIDKDYPLEKKFDYAADFLKKRHRYTNFNHRKFIKEIYEDIYDYYKESIRGTIYEANVYKYFFDFFVKKQICYNVPFYYWSGNCNESNKSYIYI